MARPDIKEKLPRMLCLAHDDSESARIELAGMLADLFLQGDIPLSLREEEQTGELIDILLHDGAGKLASRNAARRHFAARFTDVTLMPRRIAVSLVKDSLDLARPILIQCPHLTDGDLVEVIGTQSRGHALAIAARKQISEAVADALVLTGDMTVMQSVAENLGAKLSHKAIDILGEAARRIAVLQDSVMHRPEMTADAASRLYWWASQELRRYALRRFGMTSGQIDAALANAIRTLLTEHELDKASDTAMLHIADWLEERNALTPTLLTQILRMGHLRLFSIVMSRLAHISLHRADALITEAGGRGLVALCRAIGLDKPSFVSVFLLSRAARPDDHIVHPRELSVALGAFDHMTPVLARQILRGWILPAPILLPLPETAVEADGILGLRPHRS
jgi:uncharacterized protein (DUF2336 family)